MFSASLRPTLLLAFPLNLDFAISLANALSAPNLHTFLTFHEPRMMYIFRCLRRYKGSLHYVTGFVKCSVIYKFIWRIVVSTSPNPHSLRTAPFRLSATGHSVLPQLSCISVGLLHPPPGGPL